MAASPFAAPASPFAAPASPFAAPASPLERRLRAGILLRSAGLLDDPLSQAEDGVDGRADEIPKPNRWRRAGFSRIDGQRERRIRFDNFRRFGVDLEKLTDDDILIEADGVSVSANERASEDSGWPTRDVVALELFEKRQLDFGLLRNRGERNVLSFTLLPESYTRNCQAWRDITLHRRADRMGSPAMRATPEASTRWTSPDRVRAQDFDRSRQEITSARGGFRPVDQGGKLPCARISLSEIECLAIRSGRRIMKRNFSNLRSAVTAGGRRVQP